MYRLTTLGAADLLGPDGHRVNSVVQQPKRFLLLAYLTLAPAGAPIRRDALLHLFWPESDDAQARGNLKQSIYYIRRSLRAKAVVDGHDNLRVDAAVLSCDATEMEAAMAAGDHRRALDLYRGEFLPDPFGEASADIEAWLEERRARYHRLAVEAARGLALAEQGRGNTAAAAHWGRRVAELAGTSEPLMLEAMSLLVECGDRAGAEDVYAGFERRLESELGVAPSPTTVSRARLLLGEQVRNGAGEAGEEERPDPSDDAPTADAGAEQRSAPGAVEGPFHRDPADAGAGPFGFAGWWSRRRDLAVLPAILVLALLASWHSVSNPPAHDESHDDAVSAAIAVRDFDHYGRDSEVAAVAGALAATARRELTGVRGIVVVSPAVPQPAIAAAAAVRGPGRGETDSFEVRGAVRTANGELRVELALWETGSGRLVQAFSLAHPAADPDGAVESLGRRIASTVRTEIGNERRSRASRTAAPDPRAWEAVQLAEDLMREARDLRRRNMLDAATAGLMRADSVLADAEAFAGPWTVPPVTRARIASERAWLAFMPPLADTGLARAEFERALSHADCAVARAPDDAAAREMRGTIAYWMWVTLGLDESASEDLLAAAEADLKLALRSDPARVRAWILLSHTAFARADHAAAFWAIKQAYHLDVYHEHGQELLARMFASAYELGDDAGAERWCAELRQHFPGTPTAAHCGLATIAWRDRHEPADADRAWDMIRELDTSRMNPVVMPQLEMMVASILAGAGLRDSAEAVVRRARGNGPADPELLYFEAHTRALLGQRDSAGALLSAYVDADPARRAHIARSRRFEVLADRPSLLTAIGSEDGPAQ